MAKKNKRTVHNASILFADEAKTTEAADNSPNNESDGYQAGSRKSFRSSLSGGRIGGIAAILFVTLGAFGAGLKYLEDSAKRQANPPASADRKNNGSYLSTLNPFVTDPPPASTPQLSKEYIYAGSRMLAVEDKNASAAPPADIAVFRPSNGTWYVMGGQGSAATNVTWGQNGDQPVAGDFDGDGKTDFSVFRPAVTDGTWYVSNSSNGNTVGLTFGANNDKVAPADYDGDGRTDIAVYRPSNGTWYIQRSSLGFMSQAYGLSDDIVAPADYDGDGKADIGIWRGSGSTFYVLRSSDGLTQYKTISASSTETVSADYDGDGKADYGLRNGTSWIIAYSSNNYASPQTITWHAGDKAVHNDYDGDGKVDIAVWRAAIGWWFIRQSSKLGQSNELREEQWGGTINGVPDIPVPAFYRR